MRVVGLSVSLWVVWALTVAGVSGLARAETVGEVPPKAVEPEVKAGQAPVKAGETEAKTGQSAVKAGEGAGRASESAVLDKLEVTIVVGDEPYSGFLVPPADENGFKFRLSDANNEVVEFRWSTLAEGEKKRIQKLFGMEVEAGLLKWGGDVECVRFLLKSHKSVEGFEWAERALPGYRCLKTATQLMQIPKADVEREEKVVKRESEIYSAEEKYEQLLLASPPPPDSASAHMDLARTCSNMGLYDRAIDHLEMAKVIDPRTEDRNQDWRKELLLKHAEHLAERLYLELLVDRNAGDNVSALDKIDRLKRNFPNSQYYSLVDAFEEEVRKGAEVDFKKKVIFMYYTAFNDFIRDALAKKIRVDEKGRPVPPKPGKQVTTLDGRIFRGELVEDVSERIVLKMRDGSLTIARKEVLSVQDIDLSVAYRTVTPAFQELKTYVTNKDGGLGKAILDHIATKLKADPDRVKDVWENRFVSNATYQDGKYIKEPTYTTIHKAYYGKASWLRDGVTQVNAGGAGGSARRAGGSGNGGTRNTQRAGGNGQAEQVAMVDPETSDDPQVWWEGQKSDTKYQALRSLGSEKLFRVRGPVTGQYCQECGAQGVKLIFNSFGSPSWIRCPMCRGLKMLTQVYYE